jgi:hypothetical protein
VTDTEWGETMAIALDTIGNTATVAQTPTFRTKQPTGADATAMNAKKHGLLESALSLE